MKLGKLPAKFDGRTLKLSNYLDVPALPPLPIDGTNWYNRVSEFNMGGNDTLGDCVMAGAAHRRQVWTANAGREIITPDKSIITQYFKLTGGQDTGLNMLQTLIHWRKYGLWGDKIAAFVSVNPKKITQMAYANYIFGGIYIGLLLPNSAQDQDIWDVPPSGPVGDGEPGSWGGHCVECGVVMPSMYTISTWGAEKQVTPAFMAMYADEAYAIVSLDWFNTAHQTPTGLKWKELMADLEEVTRA